MSGIIGAGAVRKSGVIGGFPAGHVAGANFAATITNASTSTLITSEAVAADVVDQITIGSGNGVLIYWQGRVFVDRSGTTIGFHLKIKEGTSTSGALLSYYNYTSHATDDELDSWNLWAYDSSPASTTPDYCITLERLGGDTISVNLASIASSDLKCFLIEIEQ